MNIAVIRGGHVAEHQVSLKSGQTCIDALQDSHKIIDVIVHTDLQTWTIDGTDYPVATALSHLKDQAEVALLMLHGPFGEDGVIQGALETACIPYTGSGVKASAVANDKFVTNHTLSNFKGINIPAFALVNRNDLLSIKTGLDKIGYPLVVKPVDGGSSVETFFVDTFEELVTSIESATSSHFIVQQCVVGTELTCGVIDIEHNPQALDVIEIVPPEGKFFDYEAKYTAGASQEILPARVSEDITQQVKDMSVLAHETLGCTGITRSDFIVDTDNTVWFLEINTAPGMTATSLVPQELTAAGYTLSDVLIKLCMERIKS